MNKIQKLRSLELYLAAHPDCEENSECADRLSDVQELLRELPDHTAKLKADKAELLEALENLMEYGSTGEDAVEMKREIESLIQKTRHNH